eukprot:COSAG02_NODE_7403_length_3033_cov_3.831970_4_plen_311_part_00
MVGSRATSGARAMPAAAVALLENATPAENQGDAAKDAVGSPPSTSLGSWDVAAFSAAEKKAWPSVALFAVSPLVKKACGDATDDTDALRECLQSLKRKQLQSLAKRLRVSPAPSNHELVRSLLETMTAVRQCSQADEVPESSPRTTGSDRQVETTDADKLSVAQEICDTRRDRNAENRRDNHPSSHDVVSRTTATDPSADSRCNAKCDVCQLPFYTTSGKTVCVDCRTDNASLQKSKVDGVVCMSCGRGDSEELLLLCDSCENACHTFCCEPRLDDIPDSDWFCGPCRSHGSPPLQKHTGGLECAARKQS